MVVVKTLKTSLIFLLVTIQSILAVTSGIVALVFVSSNTVPPGVTAGATSIGGMSYDKAAAAVEAEYSSWLGSDFLKLRNTDGRIFEIPFSQIDVAVDGGSTLAPLKTVSMISDIPELLQQHFSNHKTVLLPVVTFNESKLRMALVELSQKLNIEPSDAAIYYKDGIIGKKADTPGVSLNVSNAVDVVRKQLSENPSEVIELDDDSGQVLQDVDASVKIKDFDEIRHLLAEYTTYIMDEELSKSIQLAVDSINGIILPAAGNDNNAVVFSFVEQLKRSDAKFENDNEGYDQVASALYAALLTAGMPAGSIVRLPHKLAPDYIESGLDAWISGNAGDLKFTNTTGRKIALFAQRNADRVTIAIAGSRPDGDGKYVISTEIVQRFAPPVYYVENSSLQPGEKIILNPGKEGVMVNVYRNGELISTDSYEAVKSIVQIAPGSEWNGDGK